MNTLKLKKSVISELQSWWQALEVIPGCETLTMMLSNCVLRDFESMESLQTVGR